jgi:hypothetical protein
VSFQVQVSDRVVDQALGMGEPGEIVLLPGGAERRAGTDESLDQIGSGRFEQAGTGFGSELRGRCCP